MVIISRIIILNFEIPCMVFFVSLQDVLSRPADEFGNDNLVEELWAMKAYEHAEVYFNVRLNPLFLKFMKLYIHFNKLSDALLCRP
jgi:hypothetical protein